jgi:hypothetical protein
MTTAEWNCCVMFGASLMRDGFPNGKQISDRKLAMMLKDYGIKSKKESSSNKYYRTQFDEAWESYLGGEG